MNRLISHRISGWGMAAAALILVVGCSSAPPKPAAPLPAPPAVVHPKRADTMSFVLPTQGQVLYRFDGKARKGIGIGGPAGTPVVAAADGVVVYAGAGLRGYGNMILVKHSEVFLTAYAHNRALFVKEDQRVSQGQTMAEMGSTASDVPKLHFEIRKRGVAVDPESYLTFPGSKPPRAKAP